MKPLCFFALKDLVCLFSEADETLVERLTPPLSPLDLEGNCLFTSTYWACQEIFENRFKPIVLYCIIICLTKLSGSKINGNFDFGRIGARIRKLITAKWRQK